MAYPAKRNRINQQQQQTQQMQTSSYSYNNNYPPTTTSAPVVTTTSTQPLQQPVVATAYVSGNGGGTTSSAPVVATAYVPNATTTTPSATAAPVLASAYIPANDLDDGHTRPSAPPMNPSYDPNYTSSVVSGNNNFNTQQDDFWECSVCTFPNRISETHCKGCGNANPGGNSSSGSYSKPQAPSAVQSSATSSYSTMNHINSHMESISLGISKWDQHYVYLCTTTIIVNIRNNEGSYSSWDASWTKA